MKKECLRMEHVTKMLFGVNVLDDFKLNIFQPELVNLIGLADSGKKMLISLLAGQESIDYGRVYVHETPVDLVHSKILPGQGIFCIRQQTGLIPYLSIAENIFVIKRSSIHKVLIHKRSIHSQTAILLAGAGIKAKPETLVENLTLAQQHLIELLKAVAQGAKLIVLDDISDTYTQKERDKLYDMLFQLKAKGVSVLYISHQVDRITSLADRVVIMRNGKNVITMYADNLELNKLPDMLIGRSFEVSVREPTILKDVVLSVTGLGLENELNNISFQLHRGEVLGILDLENKSNLSLAHLLTGQIQRTEGTIALNGKNFCPKSLYSAIQGGVGLISCDDIETGVLSNFNEMNNLTIMIMKKTCRFLGQLNHRVLHYAWTSYHKKFNVSADCKKNRNINENLRMLYWRWILYRPKVLVCINPCAYADYMMKEIIVSSINEAVREGISILICSSDISELSLICDRVIIIDKGNCVGELSKEDLLHKSITDYFTSHN